jgi:sugar lactone lactonase YvrE
MISNVGFAAPESVLYDARADIYLVSNVEGSALDVDDQAFISRLRPDGTLEALRWIDSAHEDVTMNAPKGMAISGDTLFVADIQEVRAFDRVSGKPKRTIHVAGSTFLNDLAVAADGSLLVTDSGLATGFAPSGSDAVLRIDREDRVTTIIRGEDLGRPNGLLVTEDGIWVSTFGTGEMYRIDAQGKRRDVKRLPRGSLDGIVALDGRIYVSSWEASAVYRADGERAEEVVTELDAPADIGIDSRRRRLLVPLFLQNAVVIHQL